MAGVEVGYATLIKGSNVRTGVTAVHPRGPAGTGDPVAAGFHSQNGNGEMTGVSWINESGTFDGPVAITNTHAVGIAHAGIIAWTVQHHPVVAEEWLLPVAAETWDGYLNDINAQHVTVPHVVAAIEAARPGPVEEGSVGGGTGMNCYHFKAGSGTASRLVDDHTVGVFVQANFGARRELVLAGVPLGDALADDNPMLDWDGRAGLRFGHRPGGDRRAAVPAPVPGAGPAGHRRPGQDRDQRLPFLRRPVPGLLDRQPRRLPARRPAVSRLEFVPWERLDPYYEAVVQATEEAVVNALVANEDMTGRNGHRSPALPRDRVTGL